MNFQCFAPLEMSKQKEKCLFCQVDTTGITDTFQFFFLLIKNHPKGTISTTFIFMFGYFHGQIFMQKLNTKTTTEKSD